MDRQPDVRAAARRELARLRNGHDGWAGRPRDIERRKAKGLAGIVGDHHLDEVLVRIAEAQERNVKRSGDRVDNGVRELQAILRIRIDRVGGRHENRLRRPRRATVGRTPEAQLTDSRLEAGPGHIDVVAILVHRVGAHGEPFLVACVVLLHDNAIAPGISAVDRFVHLDGAMGQIRGEVGEIEHAVPIDADRRIAEGLGSSRGRRHESALPGLAAIVRSRVAR